MFNLSVLICEALFVLQVGLLNFSIICGSNFLLSCGLSIIPIIPHVILSMLIISISGIPNSAELSPGSTKNLHLTHLFLGLNFTVHISWLFTHVMVGNNIKNKSEKSLSATLSVYSRGRLT